MKRVLAVLAICLCLMACEPKKSNNNNGHKNDYPSLRTPYKLRLIDQAGVTTIEFICTVENGRPGDEFTCTVTTALGKVAKFIGEPNDRDIATHDDIAMTCSGTINART